MRISIKLSFNDKKTDINAIVYNIKSEFYDFFASATLKEKISVEEAEHNVLKQLEHGDIATLYASKNNTPFKVILDWKNNLICIEPCEHKTIYDIIFYTHRALETCNNFAIHEFIATQDAIDQ